MNVKFVSRTVLGAAAMAAILSLQSNAQACGGFFCSQAAPVNQAAERIIFSENGDGTVTAVIQILYEGPAENFSWVLPISTVPQGDQIAVASDVAFQRLQNATNPQYTLTTTVEGTCKSIEGPRPGSADGSASGGAGGASGAPTSNGGVNVEASGIVGSFEWTVISVDATLPDRADVAVAWLEENGYDVAPGSRGLLRPYLEDGLHLLALKLIKGSDAGSIRPLVLTYAADKPMIPIKLTAVAANEDMGVMTWLLSESRGVPQNYLSLELNEAKINWFNPASNYNDVVSSAADEASGQGFVTEYADQTSTLGDVVWSSFDEQQWQQFRSNVYPQFAALFETAYWQWGGWDGFWDAVRMTVTLPEGVAFADFQLCPSCYSSQVQFSPSVFVEALGKNVIEPVRLVQKLLDSRPYVTRLYTTMSAEDMTVDPLFTFNPDLPTVSNVHSGNRIIECNSRITVDEAPWRIELPQGGIIRGAGPVNFSTTWPDATQSQPSNARILRLSDNGAGAVLEDNTAAISSSLEEYNAALPKPGSPGSGIGNGTGGSGANGFTPGGTDNDSSGCAVSPSPASRMGWLASVAAALAWAGRRRRSRARG